MRFTLFLSLLFGSSAAFATTYNVTNPNDMGPGTLRQAIIDANAHPGVDEIRIVFIGPISVSQELPIINDSVTIWGTSQSPIFAFSWGQSGVRTIFRTASGKPPPFWTFVNFYNVTISGYTGNGHATRLISASGDRLQVSILNSDLADGGTTGLVPQLSFCARGGAIEVLGSRVYLNSSRVYSNRATNGGAFYVDSGRLSITDSEIFQNSASDGGGAMALAGGVTTLERATLKLNTAGGYSGGGAARVSGGAAQLSVRNATFSANTAYKGGGGHIAAAAGIVSVASSTLAFGKSFGPFDKGDVLWSRSQNAVVLRDSILHANGTNACDLNLPSLAGTKNIATDATCLTSLVGDPRLFPLAPNAAATESHAIDQTSPAYKQADPATCISPSQNGHSNRLLDGTCELGSFEF